MIKRTIEISTHASHLSVRNDQLRIQRHQDDETGPIEATAPCEDIGVLIVDQGQTTYTHQALSRLMSHGAAVVICGRDHLPAGILLPVSSNTESVTRLREQIDAPAPVAKRIWKQIVQAKIAAQRAALPPGSAQDARLGQLRTRVRSGDPTNIEAQAARAYWAGWRKAEPKLKGFTRQPDGDDIVNGLLNYGYAILRAAVGRAIVAAGLHPAIGVFHRHRANTFALADDLLEPLRPLVDRRAFHLVANGCDVIDRDAKAILLQLLTHTVICADQSGPLMVALHRYVASVVDCFGRRRDRIAAPVDAGGPIG